MRAICAYFVSSMVWGSLYDQGLTGVQITGPSTATPGTQTLFNVTFWNGGNQVSPPVGGSYYWDYHGASSLVQETLNSLRVVYGTSGSYTVDYAYSSFDNYYYDYFSFLVSGTPCSGIIPSAQDVSRMGAGTVTLSASPAPSGFTCQWYAANGTTLLSSGQNYTTPSISTTTAYYLAYRHTTSGCVTVKVPVQAIISDRNYVKKYTPRAGTSNETTVTGGPPSQSYKDFTYYDGLGRPEQTVRKQATISGKDLVTPIEYDRFGRQVKEYLPYARANGSTSGNYRSTAVTEQNSYYATLYGANPYGYSEKQFEPSPLDRVDRQAAPGSAWRLSTGKEVKFSRRPNTTDDGVRIFTVNASGLPATSSAYAANQLWVEITDDEDNKRSVQYTDKLGRVVMKKVQGTAAPTGAGHTGWLCTYYVYDDLGRLRIVIPSQATQIMLRKGWGLSVNATLAHAQYFRYTYDGRGRMVQKRVPGKEMEYMLYDIQDRLVGFQDGNLRVGNKWLYTKYDALGRTVMTGITVDATAFATLQNTLNTGANNAAVKENTAKIKTGTAITSNKYDGYREYVASTSITLKDGFSMKATGNQSFTARIGALPASGSAGAWPINEGDIMTVNYYDSYGFLPGMAYVYEGTPFMVAANSRVHGLQTGKKVKNLETGEFYTTAIYYDDRGRVIQTLAQHQAGATVRSSTAYNFENQPTHSLMTNSLSSNYRVLRTYNYNVTGQLASITHKTGSGTAKTLVQYTYDDLGRQIGKTFPAVAATANQTSTYNIRGWLTGLGTAYAGIFKQTLHYNTGATANRFNGNIAGISWIGGQDAVSRTYNYAYDNANRITAAAFTSGTSTENSRYNLSGITYDANGNIQTMTRRGQTTASPAYGNVDQLTYNYETNAAFGGEYSNKLLSVADGLASNTYTSKDFKPNSGATGNYLYDANGNQRVNRDKRISEIRYNHLNLPEEISFSTGGKIRFAYDAEGNKLTQKVYNGSKALTKTQEYIGEVVLLNGALDYLVHEEGRIVAEANQLWDEFYVKDHLGNVRQVLRSPVSQTFTATMENGRAALEEMEFSQVSASRQTEMAHNVTEGGDKVAWLNAGRGRVVGPGRTQEIYAGDSLKLQVHGKYMEDRNHKTNAGSFMAAGGKEELVADLNELAVSTRRSGGANPLALLNLADILAKDLQKKEVPEAYLMYALYDRDSNRYEVGKHVLSKNAANRHEVLAENMYISRDGYMETFLVNETSEDVWFDDMVVMRISPAVVQETHYDPWGLELKGLGYQYRGIKANRYLYNGKELIDDNGLQYYDYGARMYDPSIGRWGMADPLANAPEQIDKSPYAAMWNNPIKWNDPDGRCPSCWFSLYQVAKTKYAGIIRPANAPAQRLIAGTSGNTPSNFGMSQEMRSSIKITGLSSDLNAVADVGVKLTQESLVDVGDGLDKGGEAISIGGLASTPLTGPLGLTIMKLGDGISAVGSSTKGIGYTIGGEYNSAGAEFAKAGVSTVTGKAVGKAVDYSKSVGNAPKNDFVQESVLQTLDKGVNTISSYIIDFFKEEKKE